MSIKLFRSERRPQTQKHGEMFILLQRPKRHADQDFDRSKIKQTDEDKKKEAEQWGRKKKVSLARIIVIDYLGITSLCKLVSFVIPILEAGVFFAIPLQDP